MIAVAVAVTTLPRGHVALLVRCPWCRRLHRHWLLPGHSADYLAPSCGTPGSYWISTSHTGGGAP